MKVYLAGGLSCDWQDAAPDHWEILDPRTWQSDDPAIYTERDLAGIRAAGAVLAFMSGANPSGFGMSLEIGYAHALGKPIYFVDQISSDWRSRYFGMHRTICRTFPTIELAALAMEPTQ